MTDLCNIYDNVINITNNCETSLLGTSIKTPCIDICMGALSYALINCRHIYQQSDLYEKIKH